MATSRIYPNLTGTQTSFAIPFDYLSKEHIKVSVNGVLTTSFEFLSQGLISMDTAPTGELRVYRDTPSDASLVTWTDGSILLDSDLNLGNLQTLFVTQELQDNLITTNVSGNWDADNLRIENVRDPQSAGDAVTLGWFTTTYHSVLDGIRLATIAIRDATQVLHDQVFFWRNEAEGFANAASSDANSGALSAANALTSEQNAMDSENNAAQSALEAAISAGGLNPNNNLSELTDRQVARNNLDLNDVTAKKQLPIDGSEAMTGDLDMNDLSILDAVFKDNGIPLKKIHNIQLASDTTTYSTTSTTGSAASFPAVDPLINRTPSNPNTKLLLISQGTVSIQKTGGSAGSNLGCEVQMRYYDGVAWIATGSISPLLHTHFTHIDTTTLRGSAVLVDILDQTKLWNQGGSAEDGNWYPRIFHKVNFAANTLRTYDMRFLLVEFE